MIHFEFLKIYFCVTRSVNSQAYTWSHCLYGTINMQQVLLIILLAIFGLYMLLILYYWRSWLAIPDFTFKVSDFKPGSAPEFLSSSRPVTKKNLSADCLDSVCNQSYPKHLFEVLVVDDHSTDNTAAIIKVLL